MVIELKHFSNRQNVFSKQNMKGKSSVQGIETSGVIAGSHKMDRYTLTEGDTCRWQHQYFK